MDEADEIEEKELSHHTMTQYVKDAAASVGIDRPDDHMLDSTAIAVHRCTGMPLRESWERKHTRARRRRRRQHAAAGLSG